MRDAVIRSAWKNQGNGVRTQMADAIRRREAKSHVSIAACAATTRWAFAHVAFAAVAPRPPHNSAQPLHKEREEEKEKIPHTPFYKRKRRRQRNNRIRIRFTCVRACARTRGDGFRLTYNPPALNFSTPKSTSLRDLESKERPMSHTGRVSETVSAITAPPSGAPCGELLRFHKLRHSAIRQVRRSFSTLSQVRRSVRRSSRTHG